MTTLETCAKTEALEARGAANWRSFQAQLQTLAGFPQLPSSHFRMITIAGADKGRNIYTYFPYLFVRPASPLTEQQLDRLSVAALLLLYHAIITDRMIDADRYVKVNAPQLLASNAALIRAWRFIEDAACGDLRPAWESFEADYAGYCEALIAESVCLRDATIQRENLLQTVAGKSRLARIIVRAVCELSGDPCDLEPLSRSVDCFHLASNLLDDLRDWKSDLASRRWTYLLSSALPASRLPRVPEDPATVTAQFRAAIFESSFLAEYFAEVLSWFGAASREVEDVNCPVWRDHLAAARAQLDQQWQAVCGYPPSVSTVRRAG